MPISCASLRTAPGRARYNPVINKYNPVTHAADRLYSIYSDGGSYVVRQAYGGRAAFWGDILGDWREELVLVASDYSEFRIYTTKLAATNRLVTLMHDPGLSLPGHHEGLLRGQLSGFLPWPRHADACADAVFRRETRLARRRHKRLGRRQ